MTSICQILVLVGILPLALGCGHSNDFIPLNRAALRAAMAGGAGVKAPAINDPALSIRFEIASAMAKRFSIEIIDARASNADLVLDIRTTQWGIVPTRMGHYGAKYSGTLRLTDLRTKQVLAQATCGDGNPIDDPNNPTLDELEHGGSARLKNMLRAAAQFCLEDFRKRALGLIGS